MTLLAVEAAQAQLLAGIAPLACEEVPLRAAAGRYLTRDYAALRTQPPFDASAMDGYAIRWADRAGPWTVIGEAAAGRRFDGHIGGGEAARILTGAPLPAGADTVVVQEDVARTGDALRLTRDGPPFEGAHIRRAGLDFGTGDALLDAGIRLSPARLALLAAAGYGVVEVHRRPVVALLATGNELVPPGIQPGRDQIVSSNGIMLATLFEATGASVIDAGIARDDRHELGSAIAALTYADLIVTIGGASVGDHDLVLPVLRDLGATIDFWRLALRPGKPMLAGRLNGAQVVGLPGNPVSAFVCAQLFVLPMLRRWLGDPVPLPRLSRARSVVALPANGARQYYLRGVSSGGDVTPAAVQDSGMLRTLAAANVLIVRTPHASAITAGEEIDCLRIDTSQTG